MKANEVEESSAKAAVAAPVDESKEGTESAPAAAPATPIESDSTTSAAPAAPAEPAASAEEEESKEEARDEEGGTETEEEQPSEPETPPPPPPAYSAPAYPPAPQKDTGVLGVPTGLKYPFFLHNNFLLLFILIGMIFTLIGGILSGSAIISENSDIYGASVITISLGLFTFGTFLVLAAVFRDDMNDSVRLGFLISGAIAVFGLILYSRFGV